MLVSAPIIILLIYAQASIQCVHYMRYIYTYTYCYVYTLTHLMNVCGSAYENGCVVDGMSVCYGSGLSINVVMYILYTLVIV